MNSLVGKSTGIALLMAAALIAALFAMGVFSAGTVGAHGTDNHGEDATDHTDAGHAHATITDIVVNAIVPDQGASPDDDSDPDVLIAELVPVDDNLDDFTAAVSAPGNAIGLRVTFTPGDNTKVGSVVANYSDGTSETLTVVTGVDNAYDVDIDEKIVASVTAVASESRTDTTAVLVDDTYTVTVSDDKATSKTGPGSGQSLTITAGAAASDNTDNIILDFAKFGVPSSIDTDDVRVAFTGGTAATGNPSDIEIDGNKVTLVAPFLHTAGADEGEEIGVDGNTDNATITFRRGAGITLPILHGDYDIEVTNDEEADDGVQNWVTVRRQVTVKPTSGKRGTEITITAKGYSDNTHDIVIGSGNNSLTKTADASDGVFTLTVDTAVKNNEGNPVFQGPHDNKTDIVVGDASATFAIKASFSWSPESPTPGQSITITLSDIDPQLDPDEDDPSEDGSDDVPPTITIGGKEVQDVGNVKDDKRSTWKGQVHGDTPLGNRKIAVSVGDTGLPAQNITVGTNDLTVSPTTVVPRQTISIDGDGFTPRGKVNLNDVSVDGVPVSAERDDDDTEAVNNNGNVSFDISVPETVNSGPATVKVVDDGNRVGTAQITVAKAEITVSPAESLRGETVTVSGTGFPANDLVLIKYNTATIDTASTSPTGTFSQDITVPSGSNINPGGKYKIEAVSQVNADDVSDDVDHEIKDPSITITPEMAAPGSSISIAGSNFKGFLRVALIEIGGQNVTPVPAPSTDQWGSFTADDIQVPQLDLTRHAVKVVVGDISGDDGDATEFITLVAMVEAPASTDPADVFESLGDRLERVWYLTGSTQEWAFYDPDPELADFNSLTEVTAGEAYIVIITAGDPIAFQGRTLYAGSNNIPLR